PLINEGIAAYLQHLGNKVKTPACALFSWSTKTDATVRVLNISKKESTGHGIKSSTTVRVLHDDQEFEFSIPFTDDASIENAIICCVTLLFLKISTDIIKERMAFLTNVPMRLELKSGINNCGIINDSYSSDINSFRIALDF